jgi:hypothetical protein
MMAEEKKKRMSKEEATDLLNDWADAMQLDTDGQLFEDVVEQLRLPVKLEMLTFDEGKREFTLQLFDKISGKNGEVHIVTVKPCNFASKRVLQRYKDNESIDQARAMLATYTGLAESEVKELKDLDISRINAIICGFITQVMPSKK